MRSMGAAKLCGVSVYFDNPGNEETVMTNPGVTGKGHCLKFPTAVGLPTFREDVTAVIPQPPQQGANRVINAAPSKEQGPLFPVPKRSPMSRLLDDNPDWRSRSFGSITCSAGEGMEQHDDSNRTINMTATSDQGFKGNEINSKAEGWAAATFSSVRLPFSTNGGARGKHPIQVNPVSSPDSSRYKGFSIPGQHTLKLVNEVPIGQKYLPKNSQWRGGQ
jgi:hypothetical protein